jgi:hypothetical protein
MRVVNINIFKIQTARIYLFNKEILGDKPHPRVLFLYYFFKPTLLEYSLKKSYAYAHIYIIFYLVREIRFFEPKGGGKIRS